MQTPMMSWHIIPTWHKWNTNADDIMMPLFTLYANPSDVMSGMHDTHTCMVHMLYVKLAHLSIGQPGMHVC